MKARIFIAAVAGLLAAGPPALAQDTAIPPQNTVPPAQNTQTEVIGPPQLRDFSINGTVTRPANEQSGTATPPRQPTQRPEPSAPARPADQDRPRSATPETRAIAADPSPDPAPSTAPSTSGLSESFTQISPAGDPAAVLPPAEPVDSSSGGGPSVLPWLIAALAAAGAAAWFLLRRRQRESYAGIGEIDRFEAPAPAPAPVPRPVQRKAAPPAPAPAPVPASTPAPSSVGPSGTVISTRLRPWLEIEFVPDRAVVADEKAAVKFTLTLFNSGTVPARDVQVEASMFNAGPVQDQQIQLFFDNPVAKGDKIPVIPPLQRVSVATAVFLPRDQIKPIEVEGRALLVPLIAFNALYAWSSGSGQTSATYLVGRDTQGEKLAPFRLDQGARIFRKLGARELELRVRR